MPLKYCAVVMYAMAIVLSVGCQGGNIVVSGSRAHYVDYDLGDESEAADYGDIFDWHNMGPIEFIEFLKTHQALSAYSVYGVHYGWVQEEDIPRLIALLDSSEPCLSVCMTISSNFDTQGSTVGQEAANLIQGFRVGRYPHELSSSRVLSDENERRIFTEWCGRFMRARNNTGPANQRLHQDAAPRRR